MTERSSRPFLGVKPKQAVIIAGLVGVLGILVLSQDDGAGDLPPDVEVAAAGSDPASASTNPKSSAVESQTWIPNWPDVELEQMLAQDPFAPLEQANDAVTAVDPAQLPGKAPDAVEESDPATDRETEDDAIAAFQARGVSMIFRNQKKVCALVGDRVVQEGDVIDGVRIVAITSTEVIVESAGKRPE